MLSLSGPYPDMDQQHFANSRNIFKEQVMKKYVVFMIALLAVTAFSFTQAFEGLTVIAVGDLPDCNGSDVSATIDCGQLQGANQQICRAAEQYQIVTNGQAAKDVISTPKNECMASGCINLLQNPSPTQHPSDCNKKKGPIQADPPAP